MLTLENKRRQSILTSEYSKRRVQILEEYKRRVESRQATYLENCKTMKEYDAWRISYGMDKTISEWFYREMTDLDLDYASQMSRLTNISL